MSREPVEAEALSPALPATQGEPGGRGGLATSLLERVFGPLADASARQPLSTPVPANDAAYRAAKGVPRLALRSARRKLVLAASGQHRHLHDRLEPAWRRLLWVHEGMPQIGDALMDLAPRSLLAEHGLRVDLFAAPHIARLFAGDPWFGAVLCDPAQVLPQHYDAALLLGHDHKSLVLKRARLAALPWVSLHGFYSGPDFHRGHFAAQRLADLLGIDVGDAELARHRRQKLGADTAALRWADEQLAAHRGPAVAVDDETVADVALALGGVWPERTYHHWPAVAARLAEHGVRRILLLGDGRGDSRAMAEAVGAAVTAAVGERTQVLDVVGRTDLRQAHALLGRARVSACADGGLMHLAVTTTGDDGGGSGPPGPADERASAPTAAPSTPLRHGGLLVSLFNDRISPCWRLPDSLLPWALVSPDATVDGIDPRRVVERLLLALRDDATSAAGRRPGLPAPLPAAADPACPRPRHHG